MNVSRELWRAQIDACKKTRQVSMVFSGRLLEAIDSGAHRRGRLARKRDHAPCASVSWHGFHALNETTPGLELEAERM